MPFNTLKPTLVNTIFLFCLIFFNGCKVNTVTPGKLPKKQVVIGSYGGGTGMNRKLIFLRNGQVFKSVAYPSEKEKITFVKQVPRKEARQLFKAANKINFQKLKSSEPGNMNFYVERNRLIRKDQSYRWTRDLDATNKEVKKVIGLLNYQTIL